MREPSPGRRRFPRVRVLGKVTVKISLQEISLLDLSEAGARLEHPGRFPGQTICSLHLPSPHGDIPLTCRVVHSAVSRTVLSPDGERTVLYKSGVEFLGLNEETLPALRQFLEILRTGSDPSSG